MQYLQILIGTLLSGSALAGDPWDRYYDVFGGSSDGRTLIINGAYAAGRYFLAFLSGGALLAIMFGGFKMITSAGNDEGKESAKKIVQFAVMGLIFAICAQGIMIMVCNIVKGIAASAFTCSL